MLTTIIKSILCFLGPNIDDIFILVFFFSQLNNVTKKRHIIIGEYLAVITLLLASIAASWSVSVIPIDYIGVLGIIPIYLGIKSFVRYKKGDDLEEEDEIVRSGKLERKLLSKFKYNGFLINAATIKIFCLTIANGGDSIASYTTLFTGLNAANIIVAIITSLIMVGIWCLLTLKLVQLPYIQKVIKKYGKIIVPIVFILLGIIILMDTGFISNIISFIK